MSGTSADGVSVALVSFQKNRFKLIDYETYPYPQRISRQIFQSQNLKTPEIAALNFELGKIFGQCVLSFLKRTKVNPAQISVIGSHGQTLFHNPEGTIPSTFQIGEPSVIVDKTGITVVSDFRPQDIAAGGQGAPLIPFFDYYFFGNGPIRAMQNIGGIANVTVVGKKINQPIAFDTGPGNCLIDWAIQKVSKGKYSFDNNGQTAKKGKVGMKFVQQMADHPYFKKAPPKSTGRELFNENFLPSPLRKSLHKKPHDVLATLTYFTAYTIFQSYKKFIYPKCRLSEVIVSGGGALNQTLMMFLKELFDPVPVHSIEKFGILPQAKEPVAFAFFALRALERKVNHLPSATGASRELILGKITPGKNYKGR